jgi:RsiW-degrading membrane proteinase PrsW (M82 family)
VLFGVLVALVFILPVVALYLLAIKGMDRFEPEPWWLLGAMFLWGALGSTLAALLFNELGQEIIGAAVGTSPRHPTVNMLTAVMVAPPVEESTKGFGLFLLWGLSALWLREIDGPLDGAIYGGMVGLGFTLTEDILYVSSALAQAGAGGFVAVFVLRTVLAGLGHASFTAMIGIGIGAASETPHWLAKVVLPLGGWLAAVGLHALHNYLATFYLEQGGLVVKFLVFWVFSGLFFLLLFILALRDRAIVLRGLVDEVGRTLHPLEYRRTTSYLMLVPLVNFASLLSSPGGYGPARRKQLDLVKLAFMKRRRERGEPGLSGREMELRGRIERANRLGVFVGVRR